MNRRTFNKIRAMYTTYLGLAGSYQSIEHPLGAFLAEMSSFMSEANGIPNLYIAIMRSLIESTFVCC